jgi:hypothetical protein
MADRKIYWYYKRGFVYDWAWNWKKEGKLLNKAWKARGKTLIK